MLSGIDIDVWSSAVADSGIPCSEGQASRFHEVKNALKECVSNRGSYDHIRELQ